MNTALGLTEKGRNGIGIHDVFIGRIFALLPRTPRERMALFPDRTVKPWSSDDKRGKSRGLFYWSGNGTKTPTCKRNFDQNQGVEY
jgi:hypothetical protein